MYVEKEILFFLSAAGTFNGVLLSIFLVFFKKDKTVAQLFLGLLLLMLSIRIGKSIFLYFNPNLFKTYLQIGLSGCFLIGPSLFYYLKASFNSVQKVPDSWKWVYLFLLSLLLVGGIAFPYYQYPELWGNYIIKFVIYGSWGVFICLSVFLYLQQQQVQPSKITSLNKVVLGGNILIFIAYLLALTGWIKGVYIAGSILYSFILCVTLFTILARKNTISTSEVKPAVVPDKYQNKKITDQSAIPLIEKLEQLVAGSELYKNPDIKLNELAQKINIPGHQLSQLLNDNLGKSFSSFINEYRIREACKKIIDEPHIKIEEIGYEVGFNSKSTFFTTFKKVMNTTPTLYREMIINDSNHAVRTDL